MKELKSMEKFKDEEISLNTSVKTFGGEKTHNCSNTHEGGEIYHDCVADSAKGAGIIISGVL